jgi:hypothetical protein
MLNVHVRLLPDAYRQEAIDFTDGRVDLHSAKLSADRRFRAIAAQSGRTTPVGRPNMPSVPAKMVLLEGIELSTSPLPRECSTTELQQRPE